MSVINVVNVSRHMPFVDVIQCAEVSKTTHRKWVRLIGRGYDLLHWNVDPREVTFSANSKYESSRHQWIKDIIDPWRKKALKNLAIFIRTVTADSAILYANYLEVAEEVHDKTVKEIIVYRYPRIFHIFNVIEYGRRWYRSIIFSSDPSIVYHGMFDSFSFLLFLFEITSQSSPCLVYRYGHYLHSCGRYSTIVQWRSDCVLYTCK